MRSAEHSGRGGAVDGEFRGQGWLRAANAARSATPPMKIAGSCELPLVFRPEDRVRKVLVRVVQDLSYGLIIGVAFFLEEKRKRYQLRSRRGLQASARLTVGTLYLVNGVPSSGKEGGEAVGWRAASKPGNAEVEAAAITNVATGEHFCAVKPPGEQEEPDEIIEPATQPIGGSVAWEDDGTLQWELRLAQEAAVPGFVSVPVNVYSYAKGVQPQDRQLVVVKPNKPYDMELGAEMGVARGTQWWYPGTPLQCKVVNRSKAPLTLKRGGVVARIYAVNTSGKERMRMLCDPAYPAGSTGAGDGVGSLA